MNQDSQEFKTFISRLFITCLAFFMTLGSLILLFVLALNYQLTNFARTISKEIQISAPSKESRIKVFENKMENNRPYIRKMVSVILEEYEGAKRELPDTAKEKKKQ